MALGMIVVSTNVGGVPFLIEDGRTGVLVPPANEGEFVCAIKRLASHPALAATLSLLARQKAEEFDWANVRLKWNELLRKVPVKLIN